jgi:glutathione synthase/RimK-type ligase-like ATP-grasp enzyme
MAGSTDLVVLYEHPEWQKPLFAELEKRGVSYEAFDLKRAAFTADDVPRARLYFNQASPSAYLRGNARAVPLALALMRCIEESGRRVLNGSRAFALELSKAAQIGMLQRIGARHPRSIVFNDVGALKDAVTRAKWAFPCLLKPDQGGSGARMFLVETFEDIERLFRVQPDVWLPDNLFLLQEYFPPSERGIVRMEFLGGELLYAMRVVSHGSFNLCPSETCNPVDGSEGACEVPETKPAKPVEFVVFPEVPQSAVETGKRIMREGGLDVGGIEYLDSKDGPVFYDINANSNLRPAIARQWNAGFDPFERVVQFLVTKLSD